MQKQAPPNDLSVIQKTYDLIKWWIPILNRLPKNHKFTLSERIVKGLYETRKSVAKWINKALNIGVAEALKDIPHGSEPTITEEAKAWVVFIACTQPKELGFAAEVWSRQALADYIRKHAVAVGHVCLALSFQSNRTSNSGRTAVETASSDLLSGTS